MLCGLNRQGQVVIFPPQNHSVVSSFHKKEETNQIKLVEMKKTENKSNKDIHPEGNMNVCTKFYGNPALICRGISLKTTNVSLMMALEERSGDHQSQWSSFSWEHECLHKILMSIQNLMRYFSLDQSGGPTEQHVRP